MILMSLPDHLQAGEECHGVGVDLGLAAALHGARGDGWLELPGQAELSALPAPALPLTTSAHNIPPGEDIRKK